MWQLSYSVLSLLDKTVWVNQRLGTSFLVIEALFIDPAVTYSRRSKIKCGPVEMNILMLLAPTK